MWRLITILLVLACFTTLGQDRYSDMYFKRSHTDYRDGHRFMTMIYKKMDSYIVYKGDTLHGITQLSTNTLYFEQYLPHDELKPYVIKLKDADLKTIMAYNEDKKPMCITRIKPTDKKMYRVIHTGKLNIYDDWVKYIYSPSDIDPYMLVVENNGEVDELGSFTKGTTMRDLIGYVNDIYGLKLDARNMTWSQLMHTIDELD